tara:strand:- start:23659 stop:26268 length:2610 start_codon:yes stop_codon:yes gene_type:complete
MSDLAQAADTSFMDAYRSADLKRRISRLRVALLFPILFFPPGVFIDMLVYPDQVWELFRLRILVAAISGLLLFLVHPSSSIKFVIALGLIACLLDIGTFGLMIAITEGATSPYYAGINLILLGLSVLMPWNMKETGFVCASALAFYIAICLFSGNALSADAEPIFLNNSFFILITGAICVISSGIQTRARFRDFELRHQLDVQNKDLQALDSLKTNFFSNITHELRTPLTLILGPVETILKKSQDLPDQVHENLLLAQRNALRLLKLINDLLDLTRMEQGENVLSLRHFKVGPYLLGIIDSVRHLGLSKGVSIQLKEGSATDTLEADPSKLEKIVLNLLTNAIKFTPRHGVITVEWKKDGEFICISVSDTGVGIPQENIEKIFDRFYQVGGESGSPSQGVGIGLALVKELVEQHGGRLEVFSESGEGSTFTFNLPASAESEETVQPLEIMDHSSEDAEPFRQAFRSADRTLVNRSVDLDEVKVTGSGKFTILVVEDEPDVLQYISSFLSERHRVIQAREGSRTEALIEEFQPDLLLLDWMLPGRDGLSICRELRKDPTHSDRKIVILTARVDEQSKMHALEAGADDFLLKPFSSLELQTRIENLLRSGDLQKSLRDRNQELQDTLRKLEETEAQLIQSEKVNALGSLSAGLLHEINNPLNYAYSGVQLLEMDADSFDKDSLETIQDIRDGIRRVIDVIRDLKTFAYPEKPGSQSRFTLREIVDPARKIATRDLEEIEFVEDFPEDLAFVGQKTQLLHVLINMFTNSGRALHENTGSQPPRIILRGERNSRGITLRCTDNGPGIPSEIINRIFDPFFTTRDVGEGMGMGLSICRTIVENHGGSLEVSSTPGKETTFTISIPESSQNNSHE